MRIFVAGGSGTIGVPLVRSLVRAGHQVTATTRSPEKQSLLNSLGATPVVVDALDAQAMAAAVCAASPTHVIHQLTALPKTGPKRASDLEPTNRLRDQGTRNLLRAAIAARATRVIAGSFALAGTVPVPSASRADLIGDAVRSMESQILSAARGGAIEGVVLRYGLFYGAGTPSTVALAESVRRRRAPVIRNDRGLLPHIYLDDAVSATIAALDRGRSGEVYDIVDNRAVSFSDMVRALAAAVGAPPPFAVPAWLPRLLMPYAARVAAIRLPLSNAKAADELGWHPRYPTIHEGLAQMLARAA